MYSKLLFGVYTLAVVSGCATPSGQVAGATAKPKNSLYDPVINCPSGAKHGAIDIGSRGASLFFACKENGKIVPNSQGDIDGFGFKYAKKLATDKNWETCSGEALHEIGYLYYAAMAEDSLSSLRSAATAAFRSGNGLSLIKKANDCFKNLNAIVVSPQGEGELEYAAVVADPGINKTNAPVVWGFGSTSIQLTRRYLASVNNEKFAVETDLVGADKFVELLCNAGSNNGGVDCKDGKFDPPLSKDEISNIFKQADNYAAKIDPEFVTAAQGYDIYALGNPIKHSPWRYETSNRECFDKSAGSNDRLSCLAEKLKTASMSPTQQDGLDANEIVDLLKASDAELSKPNSKYLDSVIGTLILLDAIVDRLQPRSVIFADTSLADGLIGYDDGSSLDSLAYQP